MSVNVVVMVDPGYKDTENVLRRLTTGWEKSVVFTVLELCPYWTTVLFSDDVVNPTTMYLVRPSRSHGKARLLFALSRALWKKPMVTLCFAGENPSPEFTLVYDHLKSMQIPVKNAGLTNTDEEVILEDYAPSLT